MILSVTVNQRAKEEIRMEVIRQPKGFRLFRWLWKLFLLSISIALFCIALTILGMLYLRSQPLPPMVFQENTMIYDRNGQVIEAVNRGENRVFVPLEQMPVHLLQATIAVEDQRFFQHFGIDIKRVGGAIVANIKSGTKAEGASTLTQQLARNLFLNHNKTWSRKINEAIYSIQLEMHYSKDWILEQYLNQIYFGHSAYGIEAAAQMFLGKHVSELSLAESAYLIGIPKGPLYYSPWINEQNTLQRQKLILNLLEQQGYISAAEKEAALNEPIALIIQEEFFAERADQAPYFSDYIRNLVVQQLDIPEDVFEQGGLSIYTTLDLELQKKAEEIIARHIPEDRELQTALLAIHPASGEILTFVGGRDYKLSQYNRVFASRQPGSSLKPFLYYAALEQGMTPTTLMRSEPTTFTYDDGRGSYTPRNFNDRYPNDYITMENALASSDNIYAVKTFFFVGEDPFVNLLNTIGFSRQFMPLPSLALGAQNVSLYELVKGYAVLANEGKSLQPVAILKVEDSEGKMLYENTQQVQEQLLDPASTFILNRMLRSVFEPGGTGYRVANMLNRPVAGKTGSTDTDSWMLGFTPQLVSGVWIGYDQNQFINHNNDGRLSTVIWAEFMEEALADEFPAMFSIPDGVVGAYINPSNGLLATEHCPVLRLLYFKEGTEPTEYCHEHLPSPDAVPQAPPADEEDSHSIWHKLRDWWGR